MNLSDLLALVVTLSAEELALLTSVVNAENVDRSLARNKAVREARAALVAN